MSRTLLAILCVTISLTTWQAVAAAESDPPAAGWIPQNAIFAVELSDPKKLLDLVFDSRIIEKVKSVPAYKQRTLGDKLEKLLSFGKGYG